MEATEQATPLRNPPLRLGILVVGFPHKPFTVPVTCVHTTALGDHLICSSISEQLASGNAPFLSENRCGEPANPTSLAPPHYLRFFAALSLEYHEQPRFLTLGDDDTAALLHSKTTSELKPTYFNPAHELDRDLPVLPQLVSLVNNETSDLYETFRTTTDTIHILVSARYLSTHQHLDSSQYGGGGFYRQVSRAIQTTQWPVRADLVACYGAGGDMAFHGAAWDRLRRGHRTRFKLVQVLRQPESDSEPIPDFRRLRMTRRRCGMPTLLSSRKPQVIQSGSCTVPRLTTLAVDAVLPQLLRSDPPQFLDPVDCVIDAVLTKSNRVVHSNVVCFVKFLGGDKGLLIAGLRKSSRMDRRPKMEAFVNSEMLEQLDWIVSMSGRDVTTDTLRLLVFVAGVDDHRSHHRIDAACLPAGMASVVVKETE